MNSLTLKGKTLFITGSTRGIGQAVAMRAARDGANIVITGKTTSPHPKLPGTIYSAAEEIKAAGGNALALELDVRNDEQVALAMEKAAKHFGGIDILVNNASAISLTNVANTPMKKVDLMWQVNMRGTYSCSMAAYPYLKQSKNPHILNMSPPLNLKGRWFKDHTAYTISKYGMSMCVLGMAEEFRKDKIRVNALWPATVINTVALQAIGPAHLFQGTRSPAIVADAAYAIFTHDENDDNFTGQFLIDEEVLKKQGVTNYASYAAHPGVELIKDYFLD